jgi:hypothetical protein
MEKDYLAWSNWKEDSYEVVGIQGQEKAQEKDVDGMKRRDPNLWYHWGGR